MNSDAQRHATHPLRGSQRTPGVPVSRCFPLPCPLPFLSGRSIITLALTLACVLVLLSPGFTAKQPVVSVEQRVPDLVMLVLVNQQMDCVSFVYSRIVKRSEVEAHLGNLLRETGWTADNIKVEDVTSGGSSSTIVEFTTLGTVNASSGTFPIEPIVKSFKDRPYIELQFMVNVPFQFHGLEHFEDKHVKISLKRGTNGYGYSIFVKDPDFTALNLPLVQPETSKAKSTSVGRAQVLALILIIVLGLLVAALAYFLTKRAAGSRSEN